jgi:hypothetical protein
MTTLLRWRPSARNSVAHKTRAQLSVGTCVGRNEGIAEMYSGTVLWWPLSFGCADTTFLCLLSLSSLIGCVMQFVSVLEASQYRGTLSSNSLTDVTDIAPWPEISRHTNFRSDDSIKLIW